MCFSNAIIGKLLAAIMIAMIILFFFASFLIIHIVKGRMTFYLYRPLFFFLSSNNIRRSRFLSSTWIKWKAKMTTQAESRYLIPLALNGKHPFFSGDHFADRMSR